MIKHKKRAAALNGAYVACIGNPTAQAREMVDSGILDGAAAVEEIGSHAWGCCLNTVEVLDRGNWCIALKWYS